MGTWTLSAAAAAAAIAGLAGCASTSGSPAASGSAPAPAPTTVYQRDINAMTKYCTQNPVQLNAMVAKVHQLEVQDGINDETMTQLAGHLLTTVSAYTSRVSCTDPFAAYLTLRQDG